MELNAEQIKKALECFHHRILNTKLAEKVTESEMMAIIDALALIDKLTVERDRYKRYYFNHDYDRMEATIKAETVRKMHSEIEERCIKGGIYPAFVKRTIDQIAKEMVEGEG